MAGRETHGGNNGAERGGIMETAFGFDEPEQLDLGDEDIRLPWLEGDEEEEPRRGPGPRSLLLVLSGILLLCALGAVAWWVVTHPAKTELVADGGLIAAPEGPYKVRPSDPGGEFVSGSGDTSYAVAEGQSRPVRIGEAEPDPAPPPLPVVSPAATPAPVPVATPKADDAAPAAPQAKGPGVQVGAYSTRQAAEQGWVTLTGRYEALASVSHRIVEGQADIGRVFRLQAVPGSLGAAKALCDELRAAGASCQVKP